MCLYYDGDNSILGINGRVLQSLVIFCTDSGINKEELEKFEKEFPYKEKLILDTQIFNQT
jgi:hypothetical protein